MLLHYIFFEDNNVFRQTHFRTNDQYESMFDLKSRSVWLIFHDSVIWLSVILVDSSTRQVVIRVHNSRPQNNSITM